MNQPGTALAQARARGETSTLSERCNELLMGGDPRGRDAVRRLELAGRADVRLQTYNSAPLLNRPGLLEAREVALLERDLTMLLDLLTSLPERLFDGDAEAMCTRVGINGPARRAVLETVGDSAVLLARADVVWAADGPKAIEFNVHSSLGGMDIAPLNDTFLGLPVFSDFLRAESLTHHDPLDSILREVLRAAADRGIVAPTVALIDWPTTYPVYKDVLGRVCDLMRDRGVDAIHGHVGELSARGGHLHLGDARVDVLYRIFMLEDIPEQPDLVDPILEVHRAGNVVLAMSFLGELVGNKASLALLSAPTYPDFLTPVERAAVDRILPRTRVLNSRARSRGAADGYDAAIARRADLVLKPAIGHGTLGVTPGWGVSDEEWRTALSSAYDDPDDVFVVQERVVAVPEQIPVLIEDEWSTRAYDVNWGVFIHNSRYAGGMLRALPSTHRGVISLGAGGAVGCCFHQEAVVGDSGASDNVKAGSMTIRSAPTAMPGGRR